MHSRQHGAPGPGSPEPPPDSPARLPTLDRLSPTGRAVAAAVAALALLPAAGPAQQSETPSLSFDAFGTLGVVYSTEDRADFAWNPTRPDGPGFSEEVSPDPDSRLGAQVTASVTPKLTAVVQVVSEQNHEDNYAPKLEWANVRYAFTPDFSVRVGRVALPAFLVSDFRKISYANPWIRPPPTLYGLVPVFTVDGVDASYRLHVGDWTGTLGASFGRSETDFPGDLGSAEAENALNINATAQRGGLTARLAVSRGELDIDAFDPFFDAFRAFGPEGQALADRFEIDDTPYEFATAGVEYDPGRWFGMAEIGWADFNSALGEKLAGYLSTGYRLGTVTPYVTYARSELLSDASVPGLTVEGLPPGPAQAAAGLNAGLNEFLRAMPVQQNLSFGSRWDFTPGMALKAQVDFIDLLDRSPGPFINQQPGFEPGGSAQLLSLATVFVF